MTQFIDRRLNKNKNAVNRTKFLNRYKKYLKEAVNQATKERSITNINAGGKVKIPGKDLSEPFFHHTNGGERRIIHPGNKDFKSGDKIQREKNQNGQGGESQATADGEGEDDFVFTLSQEEFMNIFFEDLALPDLIKKQMIDIFSYDYKKAGYAQQGTPNNISIIRSFRQAIGRRLAMQAPYKEKIKKLNQSLQEEIVEQRKREIEEEIKALERKIKRIPFIDPVDIRYHNRVKVPRPSTKAVMFCIMDVSGSMDEAKKEIAKRFFIILYLFLKKNYKTIDLVFIRHHTTAKEVDEETFFYSRETGGTVVSSALHLMDEIMQQRYPESEWNIYGAQASDGDNWNADSPLCHDILVQKIMPKVQYFSYVEIMPRYHQSLWESYTLVSEQFDYFAMQTIQELSDIYPVFRELFKRQPA